MSEYINIHINQKFSRTGNTHRVRAAAEILLSEPDAEILSVVAYDFPAGHKIAIALDTFDALYAVPTLLPYDLRFRHSAPQQSTLEVQVQD